MSVIYSSNLGSGVVYCPILYSTAFSHPLGFMAGSVVNGVTLGHGDRDTTW